MTYLDSNAIIQRRKKKKRTQKYNKYSSRNDIWLHHITLPKRSLIVQEAEGKKRKKKERSNQRKK